MKFGMFYPVAVASEADLGKGLWGLDRDRYASTLEELREQAICADQTGWTSMMFAEHHFEIEGYPVTPNRSCSMSTSRGTRSVCASGINTMPGGDRRPAGVIYPASTAQVQTIVRAANKHARRRANGEGPLTSGRLAD
jgi:hypothetical protein